MNYDCPVNYDCLWDYDQVNGSCPALAVAGSVVIGT